MIRRAGAALALGMGLAAAPAFAACSVPATSSADVGSFSPAAVRASPTTGVSAMPYVSTTGSFTCTNGSLLSLFVAGDSLTATVKAGTVFTLRSAAGATATYVLAADSAGAAPIVAGTARTYISGTTLNLLGSNRTNPPIYIKAQSTADLAPGDYTGSFEVKWDWSLCNGLGLGLGGIQVCLGRDTGSASGIVTVKLTVAPKGAIVTMSQRTTAEASGSTTNPKAIPGSKLRMTMIIQNPDIVPLDLDTLKVVLPTPAGLRIALDGDGTTATSVITGADSTGTTNLQFTYAAPGSTTDDVDFASGANVWGYVPTAGDAATQGLVTAVRFSPRGRMAAGTAYTITIPYSVK